MFRSPLAFGVVEMACRTRHVVAGRGCVHVDENEILKGRCVGGGVIMMYCVGSLSVVYGISFFDCAFGCSSGCQSVLFGLRAEQHFCS